MADNVIDRIRTSQKTCYFISPHFDDMAFSAGALATHLSGSNRIEVVNIFTKAGPLPYTISAKAYLNQCGYSDAEKLYTKREQEDKRALESVADEIHNLGFSEALWRPKNSQWLKRLSLIVPEIGKVYPTYRFHISKGRISRADTQTIAQVKRQLKDIIHQDNAIIFCPLGIGSHVDHIVARRACEELFPDVIYWSDFPYDQSTNDASQSKNMKSFTFAGKYQSKSKLVKAYETQYTAIFRDELTITSEKFFYIGQ